jgi:peptide/nickel transport system substrate-binding protein
MRISSSAPRQVRRHVFSRLIVASVAFACLAAVAGCDLADASNTPPEPKKGGTLFVNLQGGIESLDPQRTYNATDMNVLRLTTRTLTTYRSSPGHQDEVVPDLATDTGRPSDNNTTWKFTLKPGVKWEGGEPVVCSQVKYGIERNFAAILKAPVPYPSDYLVDNATPYQGPFAGDNNGGKGLESIQCPDEHNVVFHLKQPRSDFNFTLAMSAFAPVLPEKDAHEGYAKHVYSNGPYKVAGDLTDKGLTLVRNGFWSDTNDQARKAYPDKFVFDFGQDDAGGITNALIEDQGDARNTVMVDGNVAPNFLQQVVNDTDLSARAITGPTGGVRYFSINTKVIGNIACRQALIYAFDKRKFRAVGGGSISGDYASTMIPPAVKGHKPFDLFDSLANPEGDPDKAIKIMSDQAAAKKACPSVIQVAFNNTPQRRRQMNTVVEAYQLAGIQVQLVPIPPAHYYDTGIGDWTSNQYAMVVAGWVPDWASASAILPVLYDGRHIAPVDPVTGKASGNNDYSLLNDPQVNAQIDAAQAESDPTRQATLWGNLDEAIQQQAVTIPVLDEKAVRMSGSNIGGGFISVNFGQPDLTTLGLLQP